MTLEPVNYDPRSGISTWKEGDREIEMSPSEVQARGLTDQLRQVIEATESPSLASSASVDPRDRTRAQKAGKGNGEAPGHMPAAAAPIRPSGEPWKPGDMPGATKQEVVTGEWRAQRIEDIRDCQECAEDDTLREMCGCQDGRVIEVLWAIDNRPAIDAWRAGKQDTPCPDLKSVVLPQEVLAAIVN